MNIGQIVANLFVVSCGGHTANSCEECPQGNGAAWCNGDCKWHSLSSTCVRFCPAGSYSKTGQTLCLNCASGLYSAALASTSCTACAAGTFASSFASTSCAPCPAGTFSASGGTIYCGPSTDCFPFYVFISQEERAPNDLYPLVNIAEVELFNVLGAKIEGSYASMSSTLGSFSGTRIVVSCVILLIKVDND